MFTNTLTTHRNNTRSMEGVPAGIYLAYENREYLVLTMNLPEGDNDHLPTLDIDEQPQQDQLILRNIQTVFSDELFRNSKSLLEGKDHPFVYCIATEQFLICVSIKELN